VPALPALQFVAGATCGDVDGSGTVNGSFSDASCGSLKEYDAAQSGVGIAGLYMAQAASKCCKVCEHLSSHMHDLTRPR
jgi:hypothetical protein